jgi:hypothetical protein
MSDNWLKASEVLWSLTNPAPIVPLLFLLREKIGSAPLFSMNSLWIILACMVASGVWSLVIKMLATFLGKAIRKQAA